VALSGAAREPVDVESHELEVADLSVGALETGPQVLAVGSIEAAAPFGTVVAGDCRCQALGDHRASAAQLRRGFYLVGAGRRVRPLKHPPLGRDAKPTDDQRSVFEHHKVDQSLPTHRRTVGVIWFLVHHTLLGLNGIVVSVARLID
jgi:hypothetical protein